MSDIAEVKEIANWLASEMKQLGKGDALAAYMLGVERDTKKVKTPSAIRGQNMQAKQAPAWLTGSHLRSVDLHGSHEMHDVTTLGSPMRRMVMGRERYDLTMVLEADAKAVQAFLGAFQDRLPMYLEFGEGTLHVGGDFVPHDCNVSAEPHAVIITARFHLVGPLRQIGTP